MKLVFEEVVTFIILLQIELVHAQFKRAKERNESFDSQLEMDLDVAEKETEPDPATLKRLSEKHHIIKIKSENDHCKYICCLYQFELKCFWVVTLPVLELHPI